jgi:hypothetical protein
MATDMPPSRQFVLRDLPLIPRLVLSAFLLSVGAGYLAGLTQMHMQCAAPGELLPSTARVVEIYHGGRAGVSEMERLLEAPESLPFTGSGSMRAAFTTQSAGWERAIDTKAEEKGLKDDDPEPKKREILEEAVEELRREREAERLAMLDWVRAGADSKTYEKFPLSVDGSGQIDLLKLEKLPGKFFDETDGKKVALIQKLMVARCARCHDKGRGEEDTPLKDWKDVKRYCSQQAASGMSLTKLAQTTHVHLLGFTMLYGLTGLIFAFSSYPGLFRFLIAPLPLVAQLLEISCWWLARLPGPEPGPQFAQAIVGLGGLVAVGLALHILLSLWNMYGAAGKTLILLLVIAGGIAGWQVKIQCLDPYLAQERQKIVASQ